MHLHSFRIKNFRRLQNVHIELQKDVSIFVGANNSGKTSATQALKLFLSSTKEKFTIHDFNSECWTAFNQIGEFKEKDDLEQLELTIADFPLISLDLWFGVEESDLPRITQILPSLDWEGTYVGVRIEFAPKNVYELLDEYKAAKDDAVANIAGEDEDIYHPFPESLTEYLSENLGRLFDFKYYVLDHTHFDAAFKEVPGYSPPVINVESGKSGANILRNIIRIDCLDAQRHLSDNTGGRSEDLSRCLSRFYSRNLKKRGEDYKTQKALSDAKNDLNRHLERVFDPTLKQLGKLGYPGVYNPKLLIKSALNPATVLSSNDGATVHYALEKSGSVNGFSLPDRYNGLGFKNLIYMVVELLDIHNQWLDIEEDRPPLHLIFIEEPEAHLHTQLQQVFIRQIFTILELEEEKASNFLSQLVITTHSSHILFERGLIPVRYFRRNTTGSSQTSDVLNLSAYYKSHEGEDRIFLEKYMRLTHCDLLFADAAILVEGNVERLLLPLMIEKVAEELRASYITILEIGGAFGHKFQSLIEFLGIKALIITDIDSVTPPKANAEGIDGVVQVVAVAEEEDGDEEEKYGTSCIVSTVDAITSNRCLIKWLPKKTRIEDLLNATENEKIQIPSATSESHIRVAYQLPVDVTWKGETKSICGRTLEEQFALENLDWVQDGKRKHLNLLVRANTKKDLATLSEKIHTKVKSSGFNKTDFALGLIAENENEWKVPHYIKEGLTWLKEILLPAIEEERAGIVSAEPEKENA